MDILTNQTPLQTMRQRYQPKLPLIYRDGVEKIGMTPRTKSDSKARATVKDTAIKMLFPHTYSTTMLTCTNTADRAHTKIPYTIGVILSGGQAPGGHSVICGLFDALQTAHRESKLLGFYGGPSGLLNAQYGELTAEIIDAFRHSGGFDIIGSGRTKIETEEQFAQALRVAKELRLDAIVVIGGDDSNTNAALMAEYFVAHQAKTVVVGVPKTIDGDLQNEYIAMSFGFDTATKIYSELIGNICRDANSAQKYWHFIKLMGRSASHIALECALQTHPNICIISEEIAAQQLSLRDIVQQIVDVVVKRAQSNKNYGVVLIPEGLIEFINEVGLLIQQLNEIIAKNQEHFNSLRTFEEQSEYVNRSLSMEASYVFSSLPVHIQRQLLLDRDPHGNVQVSRIDTEQLLIEMVQDSINELNQAKGMSIPFNTHHHFFGYEGRCAYPTNFDTDYCYALGYTAFILARERCTGHMAIIDGVTNFSRDHWFAGAVPITAMMRIERRHGNDKAVIAKGLVDLSGKSFKAFVEKRDTWAAHSDYRSPGAIQYFGSEEICDAPPLCLQL